MCLQDLEGFDDDGRQRTPISEPASRQQSPFKQRRTSGALGLGPLGSGPPAQSSDTNGTAAGSALPACLKAVEPAGMLSHMLYRLCCNSAQLTQKLLVMSGGLQACTAQHAITACMFIMCVQSHLGQGAVLQAGTRHVYTSDRCACLQHCTGQVDTSVCTPMCQMQVIGAFLLLRPRCSLQPLPLSLATPSSSQHNPPPHPFKQLPWPGPAQQPWSLAVVRVLEPYKTQAAGGVGPVHCLWEGRPQGGCRVRGGRGLGLLSLAPIRCPLRRRMSV